MVLTMYTLSQIKCFITVAKYKNFSLAAKKLCITTTAVSKKIQSLEKNIDKQLLIRHTRSVKLTEFGELLYAQGSVLLKQATDIEHLIQSSKTHPQGKLHVLVSTILSKSFVLRHLAEFIAHYPAIHCELSFSEQDNDVGRDDFDILVGFPQIPPLTDNLKFRKMYDTHNILCASPRLIQRIGNITRPSDLMRFPFISHSLRKPADKLTLENGQQIPCPSPVLYMNNFEALNQACIDGIGIFLTGDTIVAPQLEKGQLVQVLPQYKFRTHEIYMFYQSYAHNLPKIRAFIDFYLEKNAQ